MVKKDRHSQIMNYLLQRESEREEQERLDDLDIKRWFSDNFISLEEESGLERITSLAEPDEKYLAKKILHGYLFYHPATGLSAQHSDSSPFIDNPKFVDKILKYLEKIV